MSADTLNTYKIGGRRIAARTDAQARFAYESVKRQARNARRQQREAKRNGQGFNPIGPSDTKRVDACPPSFSLDIETRWPDAGR